MYGVPTIPLPSSSPLTSVSPQEQQGGPSKSLEGGEASGDAAEAALRSREHVLRELVDTEEVYVSDLRLVCEGYMRQMQVSAGLTPAVVGDGKCGGTVPVQLLA